MRSGVNHQSRLHAKTLPARVAGVGPLVHVLAPVLLLRQNGSKPLITNVTTKAQLGAVHAHVCQKRTVFGINFRAVGTRIRGGLPVDGGMMFAQVFRIAEVLMAVAARPRIGVPAEEFAFRGDGAVVVHFNVTEFRVTLFFVGFRLFRLLWGFVCDRFLLFGVGVGRV